MVHSIAGRLREKQPAGFVCCEVNGVEWQIAMSEQGLAALPPVGSEVRIYTLLKVSENHMALYGFVSREERSVFEALLSVSGVGPKVALGILSKAKARDVAAAIIQGDDKRLAKLPGLGGKTAQKLVLQLGDRLAKQLLLAGVVLDSAPLSKRGQEYLDLQAALVGMGYEGHRCSEVLDALFVQWDAADLPPEGERLHQAIRILGT